MASTSERKIFTNVYRNNLKFWLVDENRPCSIVQWEINRSDRKLSRVIFMCESFVYYALGLNEKFKIKTNKKINCITL